MRICVVGNGQSPVGHGDFIDCHDRVIRVNGWWLTHPPPVAGRKCTHWSWNTALYLVGLKERGEKNNPVRRKIPRNPDGSKAVLCAENFRGRGKHKMNAQIAAAALGKPKIRYMDKNADSRLQKRLREYAGRKLMPSTGIRAIHRAILMKPHHLTIIGFDATTPDKPGWDDKGNPWRKNWNCHGFVAEKYIIRDLADNSDWLGQPVDITVDWVGRPDDI